MVYWLVWYGVAGGWWELRCGGARTLEAEHDGVSSVVRALVIFTY